MTIQDAVGVGLIYSSQSTWGTATAGATASQRLRRVSSNLAVQKEAFASREARTDQQINSARHGGIRAGGMIEGELSTLTYDDFIEATMRGTWAAGVALSEADFTSLAISSGVITLGSGDPRTLGLKIGDVIRLTNMSTPANNNVNTQIVAMTSTTVTTYPALTDQGADAACNLTVVGKKLLVGTTKRLFTMEQNAPDSDVSELFEGMRIGGMSVRIPPNGNATVTFETMGRAGSVLPSASAPYFTNITAETETEVLTGIEGALWLSGAARAIVTGVDINIANNLSMQPVIGSQYAPECHYGPTIVTGSVSYFLEDETLIDAFLNETEVDLMVNAYDASTPAEFLAFNMQRVKLNGAQKQIGAEGGVIVTSPFQALKKATATGYDASTIVIQRSNA